MDSDYLFILQLAVLLFVAHAAGKISTKLKQPAVLGQIIAGILMGFGLIEKTHSLQSFAQIGVIMLMFIAGLETDVEELRRSLKTSSLIAMGGVVAPAILVFFGVQLLFPSIDKTAALFLGIVTTATSVSISVQTLKEMDKLKSHQGVMILGAAIIDDVIGIVLLTILVGIVRPGLSHSVSRVVIDVALLFLVIIVVGFVTLRVIKWLKERYDLSEKIDVAALIICLTLAFISEEFGVAAITGAYFAGVIFSMTTYKHKVSHDINKISEMMFTPIFFLSIGMDINIEAAIKAISIGLLLVILGSIGKIIGCGFGARVSGFNQTQSLQIGIGMIPRAEVAIIVANYGVQMGILSESGMAATISMVLVSTLITPMLLKWAFNREILVRL